jgi:hypothetical protein
MTKRNTKSRKSTVKVAAAKTPVTKSSAVAAASPPLIVLGFDEQQKPRGARFVDAKPDLVIKAADLMGFKVWRLASTCHRHYLSCERANLKEAFRCTEPRATSFGYGDLVARPSVI